MNERLLIRFLTGTCTQEDLSEVNAWISKSTANADWLFEMERIWSLKNELRFSEKKEIETAYNRFIRETSAASKKQIRRSIFPGWIKYAAAVVIIGLLSANLYRMLQSDAHDIGAVNTIEVPVGQRTSVVLADGTKVWLNAGSRLTYPSHFDKKNRTVRLNGEGYFEVTSDEKHPFLVQTRLLDVTVLGTKFNVKAYKDEDISIALAEGKVRVSVEGEQNTLIMQPNEKITYSQDGKFTRTKNADTDALSRWISGELLFVDERLGDIARTLERRFGVTIEFDAPETADERFNCRTQAGASLEQVLYLLKNTKKMNYTISDQTVYIKK